MRDPAVPQDEGQKGGLGLGKASETSPCWGRRCRCQHLSKLIISAAFFLLGLWLAVQEAFDPIKLLPGLCPQLIRAFLLRMVVMRYLPVLDNGNGAGWRAVFPPPPPPRAKLCDAMVALMAWRGLVQPGNGTVPVAALGWRR